MTVSKVPSGRWRVRVKSGRAVVTSKTFDLKRDAEQWEAAQKRLLALDEFVDPNAGKASLGTVLTEWIQAREGTIAGSTFSRDRNIVARLPKSLTNRPLGSLRASDFEAFYGELFRQDLSRGTVLRTKITLSAMYTWAVGRRLVTRNPVRDSKVPSGTQTTEQHEIHPFNIEELRLLHVNLRSGIRDKDAADMVLVLGLSGLRWGELSALRVRDVQIVPYPAFRVSRSRPDGEQVRNVTKGGKPRVVPLSSELVSIVAAKLGTDPDAPLFPDAHGGMRLLSNFRRATNWAENARGHTVKDLRHSAATMWLANGVELAAVSKWLGHASVKITSEVYIHWLGSESDAAAIARFDGALAKRGDARGTRKLKVAATP